MHATHGCWLLTQVPSIPVGAGVPKKETLRLGGLRAVFATLNRVMTKRLKQLQLIGINLRALPVRLLAIGYLDNDCRRGMINDLDLGFFTVIWRCIALMSRRPFTQAKSLTFNV